MISTGVIRPFSCCGLRVERLAELHDVDAVLAERRADRRRRVRLPAGDLQLDECQNFFRHVSRSSSPGRSRARPAPGARRCRRAPSASAASGLTSTISPSKSDSGPEVTFTDSPSENSTCVRARSPIAAPVWRIRSTSACDSGTGVGAGADEAGHAGRVLDDASTRRRQVHVHEHIAGQDALLGLHLLAVLRLDHLLGRDDDAAEARALVHRDRSGARDWSSPCSRAPSRC